MPHRSVKPKRAPGAVVVVETDGVLVRAAVVDAGHEVTVGNLVQSTAEPFGSALEECVAKLERRVGTPFPSSALLLTYAAVPAVVDVPASATANRAFDEMQELLRWEIEPFIAQVGPPRLGSILVSQGVLSPADVQRVLESQANGSDALSDDPAPVPPAGASGRSTGTDRRFGQRALSLGLLDRRQLEHALEIQNEIRLDESEDIICGWTMEASTRKSDVDGYIVVSGMSRAARDDARRAFQSLGLKLQAIYPLTGTSAGAVPPPRKGRGTPWSLLELHGDFAVRVSGSERGIDAIHRVNANGTQGASERCLELLGDDVPPLVWLSGQLRLPESTAGELGDRAGCDVSWVKTRVRSKGAVATARGFLAGIEGAVRHAFDLPGASAVAAVPAIDPPLPVSRRTAFWWLVGGLVLTVLIAGFELWRTKEMGAISADIDSTRRELAEARSRTRDVRDLGKAAEVAKERVEKARASLAEVKERRSERQSTITRREGFAESLLEHLGRSVNPEVAVDRVTESDEGIQIVAWALSEPSAQSFVRSSSESLARSGLTLHSQNVFPLVGRLGLDGFGVELDFVAKAAGDE